MSLAFVPSNSHPGEILPQRLGGVGNVVLNRLSQAGRRQPKIRMHSFDNVCHFFNLRGDRTELQPGRLSH